MLLDIVACCIHNHLSFYPTMFLVTVMSNTLFPPPPNYISVFFNTVKDNACLLIVLRKEGNAAPLQLLVITDATALNGFERLLQLSLLF